MKNNHISYAEFKATDLEQIKSFYQQVFGWSFTDYGDTYISFAESGLHGGFEKTDETIVNGVLIVLYHQDLSVIQQKIIDAGGRISIETFTFPGGQRFHFIDPSGNELAVWSELTK